LKPRRFLPPSAWRGGITLQSPDGGALSCYLSRETAPL